MSSEGLFPRRAALHDDALALLAQSQPLLHRLLTEPGLTTPLWEEALGHALDARQEIEPHGGGWLRHNRLISPVHGVVELAEVTLPKRYEVWAKSPFALGPWLARQGFSLEKTGMARHVFSGAEAAGLAEWFGVPVRGAVYGRSYRMVVTGHGHKVALPVVEAFFPPRTP